MVSVYGPANVMRRTELWEKLAKVAAAFQRSPMLMGIDCNVTLAGRDRPNNTGGQDLDLKDFWAFISEATLRYREWVLERVRRVGMDSTTKGVQTRIPIRTFTLCLSGACTRQMYDSSMLRG